MITPKSTMAFQTNQKTLITPRPSSPRQFFARIYGHLESEKPKSKNQDQEGPDCKSSDKKEKEYQRECQSVSNTDSSSDFEGPKCQRLANDVQENAPASAALAHLAATSLPAVQVQPPVQRIPGFPGMPPSFAAGLATLPGFLAPRPPLLFAGEIPFHSGFSAFLSRRRRGSGRARRQRTTFSAAQTLRLEVEFRRAEYVGRPRRLELAAALRLSETQVKIWFQNRRAKDKRIEKAHLDHHYRALAGFPSEYYAGFPSGSCGLCLYKREPCVHYLVQGAKQPEQSGSSPRSEIPEQTDVVIN